jgi:acetyl-CoA C-acetyltransferase
VPLRRSAVPCGRGDSVSEDRAPVIIGVGQFAEAPHQPHYRALSPVELAAAAVREAVNDTRATGDLVGSVDTVAAIRQFEISTPDAHAPFGHSDNLPRSIANRIGANPRRAILEVAGGQGNQQLVGELGEEIARGRSQLAIIAGAEAISTVLHLKALGEVRDWSEAVSGDLEDRGFGVDGLLDGQLARHGLDTAIAVYALFDNARRARLHRSLEEYRLDIGRLFAPFSRVAAANPLAAARVEHTAEALATVTDRNRIVAEPYARMTVARDQVNQAAALVVCSVAKARALGVPSDRWVHIHGIAGAHETMPLERPDLSRSPASVAASVRALQMAGKSIDDMNFFDLYSCFAIPVFNIIDAFGLAVDDPRGYTLTGGLPFFGGAGNNYSMHAIAEAVARLRARPGTWAFVGANGGFMSKYSAGVYSTLPASWDAPESRNQSIGDHPDTIAVVDAAGGPATIESYTIVPRAKGDLAAVVARLSGDGARCVAVAAPEDGKTLAELKQGMPFGRPIQITAGVNGRNVFDFA